MDIEAEKRFPLEMEKVYLSTDFLTLPVEGGEKTLKLGAWLNEDPVRIHRMIVKEKTLTVDAIEVFYPLESKLRRASPEYYKKIMGLKIVVDFPGYDTGIVARIPYENDPVGFYKWWRKGKHEDKVYLSRGLQIALIQKVLMMEPKLVLKKDLELLK